MACWFYVGKVLTSLAFLSEIMGSDMIFNMLAMIVFPLFVILGPVILVFVITGFYFCTSQLSKESSSFKESYASCRESKFVSVKAAVI